jgi:hypothetical protein
MYTIVGHNRECPLFSENQKPEGELIAVLVLQDNGELEWERVKKPEKQ